MVLFLCCPFTNEFLLNWQPSISLRLRERGFVVVSNGLRKAKHLHVIFLRLERKRGADTWISPMKTSDGSTVSDIVGICVSWGSFYSDLFSASSFDLDFQVDLLDNISLSLSSDESASCEG